MMSNNKIFENTLNQFVNERQNDFHKTPSFRKACTTFITKYEEDILNGTIPETIESVTYKVGRGSFQYGSSNELMAFIEKYKMSLPKSENNQKKGKFDEFAVSFDNSDDEDISEDISEDTPEDTLEADLTYFNFDPEFNDFLFGTFKENFNTWVCYMRKDYQTFYEKANKSIQQLKINSDKTKRYLFKLYSTFKNFNELTQQEINKRGCKFTTGLLAKKTKELDYISFDEISMNYNKTDYPKCYCEWMFQNKDKFDEEYKFVVDIDEIESETSNKETMNTFVKDAIEYMKKYPKIRITISGYFKNDNNSDIIEGKVDNVKYMICGLKSELINVNDKQTESVKKDVSLHIVFDNVSFNKEIQEYFLNQTSNVSYLLFGKYNIDQSIFSEGRKFRSLLSDKVNLKYFMQQYVVTERYNISLLRNKNFKKEYIPYIHCTNIFESLEFSGSTLENTLLIPKQLNTTQKIKAFDREVKQLKEKQQQITQNEFDKYNTVAEVDFDKNNIINEELFKCEDILNEFKKLYNVYDNSTSKSIENMISVLFDTDVYKFLNSEVIYDFYTKDSGYLLLKYHNLYGSEVGRILYELLYRAKSHTTDTNVFFGLVKEKLESTDPIDNFYYSMNIVYSMLVLPIANYFIEKVHTYSRFLNSELETTYVNICKKADNTIKEIEELIKNKASINIIISNYNKFFREAIIQARKYKDKYIANTNKTEEDYELVIAKLRYKLEPNEYVGRLANVVSKIIQQNKQASHDDIFVSTKYSAIDIYNHVIPKHYYYFISFYSQTQEIVYYRSILENDLTKVILLTTSAANVKQNIGLEIDKLYCIDDTDKYKCDIEERIFDYSGYQKYITKQRYYDTKVVLMLDKLRSTFCTQYEYETYLYAMQQKIINKTCPINFGFFGGKSSLKTYFSTIFGNIFNSKTQTQILDFPTILGNFNQYALDKYIIIDEFSLVDKKRIIDYIKNIQIQYVTINLKNVKPFTIKNKLNIVLNCNADEDSLPLNGLLNLDVKSDLEAILKRLCVCKRLSLKEDISTEEYYLQNDNGFIYAMKQYVKNMKIRPINFFTRKYNQTEQDLIDQHNIIQEDKKALEEVIDMNPFVYTVMKQQPKDNSWFQLVTIKDVPRLVINYSVFAKVYKRITNKPIPNSIYNKSGHIVNENYKNTRIRYHKHTELFCELVKKNYDIYLDVEDN